MQTSTSFGEIVKALREARQLPLREVADALQIDTSMLGKIEKNSRRPSRKLIEKFAAFFGVSEKNLRVAFLSDLVAHQAMDEEDVAGEVLKVAEEKVAYLKNNKKREQ